MTAVDVAPVRYELSAQLFAGCGCLWALLRAQPLRGRHLRLVRAHLRESDQSATMTAGQQQWVATMRDGQRVAAGGVARA